ncbi:MAG: type I methionyl aminopeptidase [Pyrinomonadaceae bacterium]|nr:type I methionyl aminopeptidase [Pyrinomonadaceae bacterium]MCX7639361.1 type I methionyl aminopeptidase [Pyrinomonadaceae bacterium]MDW8305223.1 type I methionyl aminopeptidase [Acidobacteriota bacterium]
MIIAKSQKDLERMREVGELVAEVREELRRMIQVGITSLELNNAAEKMIRERGAIPTFIGYRGFPFAICASVNEQVVHGFSNSIPLKEGDIISIDVAATYNGFVGDTAFTAPVGKISEDLELLLKVTEECLYLGIQQCYPNKHIGDIGYAIQTHAEKHGFSVVRDYVGHGIGRRMHEDPQVPNYGRPGTREKLRVGYCLAIEPMLNMGTHEVEVLEDGWTVVTKDRKPSAHFEHTVAITAEGPEILTLTKEQKAQRKSVVGLT